MQIWGKEGEEKREWGGYKDSYKQPVSAPSAVGLLFLIPWPSYLNPRPLATPVIQHKKREKEREHLCQEKLN